MYINAFRTCSLLLPSLAFRSLGRNLALNSKTNTVGNRRSGRFFRNFFLTNGIVLGGGSLYYLYFLTPKERRQVRVTFEGIRRGIR